MSEQVKSQIKHSPMLQETIEAPTGVFPPLRSKPVGSNGAGMSVLTNYFYDRVHFSVPDISTNILRTGKRVKSLLIYSLSTSTWNDGQVDSLINLKLIPIWKLRSSLNIPKFLEGKVCNMHVHALCTTCIVFRWI